MTPRIVLVSHDSVGLGHTRRNARIAAAVLRQAPQAQLTLVTGVSSRHRWLDDAGPTVVRLPAIGKDATGAYCAGDGTGQSSAAGLAAVLRRRRQLLDGLLRQVRPDVVLVDRHPFGIAGEWREPLVRARRAGTRVLLGLRDILDDPQVIRRELTGPGWHGAEQVLDDVLVYGQPLLADHARDYGLTLPHSYVGVVTADQRVVADPTAAGRVVVTVGGGADSHELLHLVRQTLAQVSTLPEPLVVAGPSAGSGESAADCSSRYAAALASVQMAGYNSTYEALAAGLRPILVPRRAPRREQAIRAQRLAALGLADVLDAGDGWDQLRWLLERPRRLAPDALARAGLDLAGADRAADRVLAAAEWPARGIPAGAWTA